MIETRGHITEGKKEGDYYYYRSLFLICFYVSFIFVITTDRYRLRIYKYIVNRMLISTRRSILQGGVY